MEIFIVSEDKANAAYRKAQELADTYKDWRWGQCVFNAYYTFFPDECNKLRGTDDDCFYRNDRVEKFLSHFQVRLFQKMRLLKLSFQLDRQLTK